MQARRKKLKIGEILVQEGLLTHEQVTFVLDQQKARPAAMPFGELCVELGLISPIDFGRVLTRHHRRLSLGELLIHLGLDAPYRHAQESIDLPHPSGITPREVIVHRDDMHAPAGDGVEIGGQRSDQSLSFPGLHLGDPAFMQHDASDELHIEVAHAECPAPRFANDRESIRQELVERGLFVETLRSHALKPLAQAGCAAAQLPIRKGEEPAFEPVDLPDDRFHLAQIALRLGADHLGEDAIEHIRARDRKIPRLPRIVPGWELREGLVQSILDEAF